MVERQDRAASAAQGARERTPLSRLFDPRRQLVVAVAPAVVVAMALVVAWWRA